MAWRKFYWGLQKSLCWSWHRVSASMFKMPISMCLDCFLRETSKYFRCGMKNIQFQEEEKRDFGENATQYTEKIMNKQTNTIIAFKKKKQRICLHLNHNLICISACFTIVYTVDIKMFT